MWSGAASASLLWFFTLALGAAWLAPWLARPGTWRLLDLLVAVMMFSVACQLISAPVNLFQKALEPLSHTVVAWLCRTPGAMIQPLRRKEYKLPGACLAARDRPCAHRN